VRNQALSGHSLNEPVITGQQGVYGPAKTVASVDNSVNPAGTSKEAVGGINSTHSDNSATSGTHKPEDTKSSTGSALDGLITALGIAVVTIAIKKLLK
jgi:hypothetical protein